MQIAATDRKHLVASLQVNLGGLVESALDVADSAQVDDDRSVYLRKLNRVELRNEFF